MSAQGLLWPTRRFLPWPRPSSPALRETALLSVTGPVTVMVTASLGPPYSACPSVLKPGLNAPNVTHSQTTTGGEGGESIQSRPEDRSSRMCKEAFLRTQPLAQAKQAERPHTQKDPKDQIGIP